MSRWNGKSVPLKTGQAPHRARASTPLERGKPPVAAQTQSGCCGEGYARRGNNTRVPVA